MPDEELFEKGLKTRRQVLGAKYVDANLAGSDDFMMTFQRAVTEGQSGSARNVLKTSLVTHCRRRRSSLLALRYSYSISSSALSRIDVGTSRPSALAVVILSTVSYFTDNCTGRSAGFSLLRMRST